MAINLLPSEEKPKIKNQKSEVTEHITMTGPAKVKSKKPGVKRAGVLTFFKEAFAKPKQKLSGDEQDIILREKKVILEQKIIYKKSAPAKVKQVVDYVPKEDKKTVDVTKDRGRFFGGLFGSNKKTIIESKHGVDTEPRTPKLPDPPPLPSDKYPKYKAVKSESVLPQPMGKKRNGDVIKVTTHVKSLEEGKKKKPGISVWQKFSLWLQRLFGAKQKIVEQPGNNEAVAEKKRLPEKQPKFQYETKYIGPLKEELLKPSPLQRSEIVPRQNRIEDKKIDKHASLPVPPSPPPPIIPKPTPPAPTLPVVDKKEEVPVPPSPPTKVDKKETVQEAPTPPPPPPRKEEEPKVKEKISIMGWLKNFWKRMFDQGMTDTEKGGKQGTNNGPGKQSGLDWEVNLVPEEALEQEISIPRILYLVMFMVLAAGVVFGGWLWTNWYYDNITTEINKIDNDIELFNIRINSHQDIRDNARELDEKISNVRTLLDKHVYWSRVFSQLEENIIPEVYLTSMAADVNGSIKLSAIGKNYESAIKQLMVLNKASGFVSQVTVSNISFLGSVETSQPVAEVTEVISDRGVQFTIDLTVLSNIFYFPK